MSELAFSHLEKNIDKLLRFQATLELVLSKETHQSLKRDMHEPAQIQLVFLGAHILSPTQDYQS